MSDESRVPEGSRLIFDAIKEAGITTVATLPELKLQALIDLVAKEYNADTSRIYIHGQNPSGSGALHLAAKYPDRFAALVVSSGPIVLDNYPFNNIKGKMGLLVIHGDQDTNNPIAASQKLAEAAKAAGVETVYATVPGGTHLEA